MSCDDIQSPIARAIVDLETAKQRLLAVYEWASVPKMFEAGEPGRQAMQVECARLALPIIERQLKDAFKVLTGTPQ